MSNARPRATKLEDTSPEARERRAQVEEAARALAEHQRREAEIEAMSPEERIAARLVEKAGGAIYRPAYESLAREALANGGVLKDTHGAMRRAAKVEHASRDSLLRQLQDAESKRAGIVGAAPTGRMSVPMTRKAIQTLVRIRYPRDTKNLGRWWDQRIKRAGITVVEPQRGDTRIDLGQLMASLPERRLTEDDITPWLAA